MATELTTKEDQQNMMAKITDKRLSVANRVHALKQLMLSNEQQISSVMSGLPVAAAVDAIGLTLMDSPNLLECTIPSLFRCAKEATSYGWQVGGLTKDCYIVPFKNRGNLEATLIPGYQGLRRLVERSAQCQIVMEAIHDGDEFEFVSPFDMPKHKRSTDPQRRLKPVLGAYVAGRFRDGTTKAFHWHVAECLAHRDRYSKGWKRQPEDQRHWDEGHPSFPRMCCKTVLRAAVSEGAFPMSVQDLRIAERDDPREQEPIDADSWTEVEGAPHAEPEPESEPAAKKPKRKTKKTDDKPEADEPGRDDDAFEAANKADPAAGSAAMGLFE